MMKNKAVEISGKRAWLFASRVFGTEDFKADASNYRKTFNIPKSYFKSYSDASHWFTELYFDTIDTVPPEKQSDLKTIHRSFRDNGNIPIEYTNELENDRKYKILEAWFALEDIRHKYAFPPRWSKGVLTVLLTNKTSGVYLPAGVSVIKAINGLFYEEEIEVRADRFTRKKDFDEAWKVVKQMQKSLWGSEARVKQSKSFSKYKRAADMKNIEKLPDKKIAEELAISPSEVPIYIARYYQRIGVNSKRTRYL